MARTLSAVAQRVRGELRGADAAFAAVSTDSRGISRGDLFVALVGERFDGHDFLADVHAKGAAGAMVARPQALELSQIHVDDTRLGLGRLAHAWRQGFDIPVVGVTGSNGKTTVKEMIAAILGVRHQVLATRGNLNNDIGVPLTLLRLSAEHEAAVVEMGANHAGEIEYLASLAEPVVGVVTNAAAAHLEGFGSLDGVVAAKGELFRALPADGTAVINLDDPAADRWRAMTAATRMLGFGLSRSAFSSVTGPMTVDGGVSRFTLRLGEARCPIQLPLLGRHNVVNALAAAAAAHALGATLDDIAAGWRRAGEWAVACRWSPDAGTRDSLTTAITRTRRPCARRSNTWRPSQAAVGWCSAIWQSWARMRSRSMNKWARTPPIRGWMGWSLLASWRRLRPARLGAAPLRWRMCQRSSRPWKTNSTKT